MQPFTADQPVSTLAAFDYWVKTSPAERAVSHRETHLTYRELDIAASNLASQIKGYCRNTETINTVAVFTKPGLLTPASIIACLRTGTVYVPLNPEFPPERISRLFSFLQPQLVITDSQSEQAIPEAFRPKALVFDKLDTEQKTVDHSNQPGLQPYSVPQDISAPAYILFTSGTTGTPKAVLASVKNLDHLIFSSAKTMGFDSSVNFLALAKPTFSISFMEIMTPLCCGGSVRILGVEEVLDPETLINAVTGCNGFHMTPNLFRNFFEAVQARQLPPNHFDHIQKIVTGGDLIPIEIVHKIGETFNNASVTALYGCSEVAVMACYHAINFPYAHSNTLAGVAFANVKMIICDENLERLPPGEKGEICISGPGVTEVGYYQDEAKTKERFVTIEDSPYYRTGDVGSINSNGDLRVFGREDFQVQINGIRVELAEIEVELRKNTLIKDCAVVSFSGPDNTTLVYGFLTSEKVLNSSDIASVRAELTQSLPAYMHPNGFTQVEKLPVNANQKLDRKALDKPHFDQVIRESVYEAPANITEQTIIALWEQRLEVSPVGVRDNFFYLGGTSLTAAKIIDELNTQFNTSLSIAALVSTPTVRGLAHKIDSGDEENESNCVLLREGNGPKVFCFYGVLLYKDLADSFTSDVSIYGVFLQDEIDLVTKGDVNEVIATLKSVENIVDLYIESIKVLQPNGPYYICGESFGGLVALETARKLEASGEEVRFVGMFDTWHPKIGQRGWRGMIKSLLAKTALNSLILKYIGNSRENTETETEQQVGEASQDYQRGVRAQARNFLLKNYVSSTYARPIYLFTAQDRPTSERNDNTLGWTRLLPALEVTMVPGDHIGIMRSPNAKVIAQKIEQILKQ